MGKKSKGDEVEELIGSGNSSSIEITPDIRRSIFILLAHQEKIDILSTSLKETKKNLAEKLMLKPAKFNSLLADIKKEMQEGGVIPEKEEDLDFRRNMLEQMDLENPPKIDDAGLIDEEVEED